jgi:hypothetical protein
MGFNEKGDKNEEAFPLIFIAWFDSSRRSGMFCSGDPLCACG